MKRLITPLVLCAIGGLHAQASLPKALVAAKTVYIVNDGAYANARDDVASEIIEWGRFQIVDSQDLSDITITIGKPRAWEGTPMTVTDSKSKSQLWTVSQKNIWGHREVSRQLVKRLRERLEPKKK